MTSCDLSYLAEDEYAFYFEKQASVTGELLCYECNELKESTFQAYEQIPVQCFNFATDSYDCERCEGDCNEEEKQKFKSNIKIQYICEDCESLINAFNICTYGNLHQYIIDNITNCYKELSSEFYDKLTPNARAYIERLIDEIDEESDDWK